MSRRRRLDDELVRRGLMPTGVAAAERIAERRVLVNGAVAENPARQVLAGDAVRVTGEPARFVGRGGEKLAGALGDFALDVAGRRCLDAGASTGGFTDCLLQRGAAHVVALDVGHGQLHPRVRADHRVRVIERFNVRRVTPGDIGGPVELVVADLSFISLTAVAAALVGVCCPGGSLVLLVKPQFEVERREAGRGRGVVRDERLHEMACAAVEVALRAAGAEVRGRVPSRIEGAEGNREFLIHAEVPPCPQ